MTVGITGVRMRYAALWLSLTVLGASQASAEVYFCHGYQRYATVRYVSGFFEAPNPHDGSYGDRFEEYLKPRYTASDQNWEASCYSEDTLSRAESRLDWFKYNNKDITYIDTGFALGFPLANSASKVQKPSGPFLTVESDDAPKRAAEAAELVAVEAQRRDAENRARVFANAARTNAEYQAQMTKFFDEMRKRGSAQ